MSKPHHGGFLTGGNMPVSHDEGDDNDDDGNHLNDPVADITS